MKLRKIGIILVLAMFCLFGRQERAKASNSVCQIVIDKALFGSSTSKIKVDGKYVTLNKTMDRLVLQTVANYAKNLTDIEGKSYSSIQIILKPGTYQLDVPIVLYSNTAIVAQSGTKVVATGNTGSLIRTAWLKDLETTTNKGYDMVRNISITGGVWNSNSISGSTIRLTHTSNATLKNMEICNIGTTGHMIALESCKNVIIDQCNLHTVIYAKAELQSNGGAGAEREAIHIDTCHDEAGTPGLTNEEYDDLPCDGITITNNRIDNAPTGIGSHFAVNDVYHKNIVITGNTITNTKSCGIRAYKYKNLTIQKNSLSNVGMGIRVLTLGKNTVGNILPNVEKEPAPKDNNYNVVIQGNTIKNVKGDSGIYVSGSASLPIASSLIDSNTIENVTFYGIFLSDYCQKSMVTNNTIKVTGKNGIQILNASNGNIVKNNKISGTKQDGIYVGSSSSNNLALNKVSNVKGNGIIITNSAHRNKVQSNSINKTTSSGIMINRSSTGCTIMKNKLVNIKKHGIYIAAKSTKATIQSNTVNDGVIGIFVTDNCSGAAIKSNMIGTVTDTGIFVRNKSGSTTIEKNTITAAKGNGICIMNQSNSVSIVKNTVKKAKHGIVVKTSCNKVSIKSNSVRNCKGQGIFLQTNCKNGTIAGNAVTNTTENGIYVGTKCSSIVIRNNKVASAKKNGIMVYDKCSNVTVTNNRSLKSKMKPWYQKNCTKVTFKNNKTK